VQLLLHLADLTAEKSLIVPSSDGPFQHLSLLTSSFPLSWLESVWMKCTAQVHELDGLIRPMLDESGDSQIQKARKRILILRREEKVKGILREIECYKTMLSIWFGQECFDQIRQLKQ
jgi:hypothetical protein